MSVRSFLEQRFVALNRGDYRAVFRSYDDDAPLRAQFSGSDDYISFARQQLAAITVRTWNLVDQRPAGDGRVECLLAMELEIAGERGFLYENALLIERVGEGWRYHSAQKLGVDDYDGDPEQISFADFDRADDKIRY